MTDDAKAAPQSPIANAYTAEGMTVSPSAMTALMGGVAPRPELDEKFTCQMASLGAALGLKKLGVSMISVEPGKRAFPFHNHHGKDELFVILDGEGAYRFGDQEHAVKAGDLCAAPYGGPETAHQLINTGQTTLRYLAISSMQDPEVVEYPDSGKFGVIAIGDDRTFFDAKLRHIGRREDAVGYWDGES